MGGHNFTVLHAGFCAGGTVRVSERTTRRREPLINGSLIRNSITTTTQGCAHTWDVTAVVVIGVSGSTAVAVLRPHIADVIPDESVSSTTTVVGVPA